MKPKSKLSTPSPLSTLEPALFERTNYSSRHILKLTCAA